MWMYSLTACLVAKMLKGLWNLANEHFLEDTRYRPSDVAEDWQNKAWGFYEVIEHNWENYVSFFFENTWYSWWDTALKQQDYLDWRQMRS